MLDLYANLGEIDRKILRAYREQETAKSAEFRRHRMAKYFEECTGPFEIPWFLGGAMICPDEPLLAWKRSCYQKITDIFDEVEEG